MYENNVIHPPPTITGLYRTLHYRPLRWLIHYRFSGNRREHHDRQSHLGPGATADVSQQPADAYDVTGGEEDRANTRFLHSISPKHRQTRRDSTVGHGALHGRGQRNELTQKLKCLTQNIT